MTTVSKEKLEAFRALEDQEAQFLKICGWHKNGSGWLRREEVHASVPRTQGQAVAEAKRDLIRAQLLGGVSV